MDRRVRDYFLVTFPNGSEEFRFIFRSGVFSFKIRWKMLAGVEYALVSMNKSAVPHFYNVCEMLKVDVKWYSPAMEERFIEYRETMRRKLDKYYTLQTQLKIDEDCFRIAWLE